jgi:hypothetical protein
MLAPLIHLSAPTNRGLAWDGDVLGQGVRGSSGAYERSFTDRLQDITEVIEDARSLTIVMSCEEHYRCARNRFSLVLLAARAPSA